MVMYPTALGVLPVHVKSRLQRIEFMTRDDAFNLWAGRLCLGIVGALGMLGTYYGNVRFAPVALGFGILSIVCYAERRMRPIRAEGSRAARPSLISGDAPRIPSHSPHSLGS